MTVIIFMTHRSFADVILMKYVYGFIFSLNRPSVLPDILHVIGNTPLIKLNKIPQAEGLKCDVCEYMMFCLCLFISSK